MTTSAALQALTRISEGNVMNSNPAYRGGWTTMDTVAEYQKIAREALAAPAPFDMLAHLARQAEFSARTFGPGARVQGVTDHIAKELKEVRDSGGALAEWVDVIILAFDGAWRSGATPEEIIAAMVAKQAKNESRTWPDWRTADPNKAIEHDRSGEAAPAPALDAPAGAIENGRCHIQQLEDYGFECQGGPLRNCADWQQLVACFEWLADWAARASQPTHAHAWDASQIKQPGWDHVFAAFVAGAQEARANPEASMVDFGRAADGYTKRVFEEVDPASEKALRTESWPTPAQDAAATVPDGLWAQYDDAVRDVVNGVNVHGALGRMVALREQIAPQAAPTAAQAPALVPRDCGEAGHDEGRCGNASCIAPRPIVPPATAAELLLAACMEFVRKCDSGEAKSKRSYAQMQEAIAAATAAGITPAGTTPKEQQ